MSVEEWPNSTPTSTDCPHGIIWSAWCRQCWDAPCCDGEHPFRRANVERYDYDADPAACTCVPASSFFPAEPDDTCPQHRSYDPEEG